VAGKDVSLSIGVDIAELVSGMTAATEAVKASAAQMKDSLESVSSAFSLMSQAAVGITAVLGGGKIFGEAIASTVNLNVQSLELGKQFGISATQASILKVALGETFLTQDQLAAAGARMTRTLNTNEGAFKSLGVATRDSSGNFRPMLDIMTDVNAKLLTFKEGTDRNVEAVKIYGKGWQEVAPTLRLTTEAMADAKVNAEALNLVVSAQSEAATAAYRSAMVNLNAAFDGMKNTIGQAVIPTLTSMANWFRENVDVIAIARASIATIVDVFLVFKDTLTESIGWLVGQFVTLGLQCQTTAKVILDALTLDWGKIKTDNEIGLAEERAVYQKYLENIAADQKQSADIMASFDKNLFDDKSPTAKPAGTNTSEGGAGANKELMAGWTEELAANKAKWAEEVEEGKRSHLLMLSDEAAFWKEKLAAGKASGTTLIDLEKKIADASAGAHKQELAATIAQLKEQESEAGKSAGLRIGIAQQEAAAIAKTYGTDSAEYSAAQKHITDVERQAAAQSVQIANEFAKVESEHRLVQINEDEKIAEERYSRGEITANQLAAIDANLENERYEIARKGIQDREALIDPATDAVAAGKLNAEMEGLELQHQDKMTEIQKQALQNNSKLWDTFDKSIQQDFTQAISGMLKGTETFQEGMKKLFTSILSTIIDMLAQWVVKWAATQLANLVSSKTTAAGQIGTYTGIAGAAGVASFAGAPWPIDLGAPAFGAEAAAAAGAFSVSAAAAGGYDIPAGVDPVAKLHAREMVLPAELSDGIRSMIAAGGGGGSSTSHVSIRALDGRSIERVLRNNPEGLRKVLQKMHGNYRR
jgi:hypothetical protein